MIFKQKSCPRGHLAKSMKVVSTPVLKSYNKSMSQPAAVSSTVKNDFLLINRLGALSKNSSFQRMSASMRAQLCDLLNRIYDTFFIHDNEIVLLHPEDTENILIALAKEINAAYFIVKLTSLKGPGYQDDILIQSSSLLISLFERLLKLYASKGADSVTSLEFNVILSLGFLTVALSQFIGKEACNRADPSLTLLLSLTPVEKIVQAFKIILPEAHQSRLFTLTIYRDLQKIENHMEKDELDQTAKLKGVMELVLLRYGPFFLNYYADEILITFRRTDLLECPEELWKKATHGGNKIQAELGPSFLANMIKFQWGIIKDFNGIVPDPSNDSILYHTELENLFEFLVDQGQQLFLLTGALYSVLEENPSYQSTFVTDAELLTNIYTELMDHLSRIVTALNEAYTVKAQCGGSKIDHLDALILLQSTKFYVLLLSLSLCLIQLSLTGPLNISTVSSVSPIIEQYLFASDFTATLKTIDQPTQEFKDEFKSKKSLLCSNYSMIKKLSSSIFVQLEGNNPKPNALRSGMSWNMLNFTILVTIIFSVLSIRLIQAIISLLDSLYFF